MDFYLRFPEGCLRAVTLSYDDGVVQDERFLDIINKHGLKCTFNINGVYVDPDVQNAPSRRMSREQATALYCLQPLCPDRLVLCRGRGNKGRAGRDLKNQVNDGN